MRVRRRELLKAAGLTAAIVMSAFARRAVGVLASLVLLSACGSAPASPASGRGPTAPTASPPPSGATDISGTWRGSGSDSFGPELVTWVLTQSGAAVSGVAEMNAVDPADGSCGSCHKVKRGTLSGTMSGGALSVTMTFPAGADVPTPICVADLTGSATVQGDTLHASYSGSDTCEGFFADGRIDLTRQP